MSAMCPHCGAIVSVRDGLTVDHVDLLVGPVSCPGSMQNSRCAESDARPLWNGQANRYFAGGRVICKACRGTGHIPTDLDRGRFVHCDACAGEGSALGGNQ